MEYVNDLCNGIKEQLEALEVACCSTIGYAFVDTEPCVYGVVRINIGRILKEVRTAYDEAANLCEFLTERAAKERETEGI